MGIYLPSAGTLDCAIWPGARITCSQGIPPHFYPPHMNMELPMPFPLPPPPLCTTPHLLTSLPSFYIFIPPTHLDECDFLKSLVVVLLYSLIFWQFSVLLVLRLSCNSFCGCAMRWSVSTYASILARSPCVLFYSQSLPLNISFHANKSILAALFLIMHGFFLYENSEWKITYYGTRRLLPSCAIENGAIMITLFIYWSLFHLLKHL